MSLVIPDEIVKASGMSKTELMQEIVLMLFQQKKISIGKASRLVNMNLIQFQHLIASRGICVHYDVADFREDLKTIKELYGE
jgi:predicted HTH domain antitoxin